MLGKWLAVSLFSVAGLAVNLSGFALIFTNSGIYIPMAWPRFLLILALGVFPLPLLAASLQLLGSTISRTVKEAHTYLSLIVFLPMGLGMFLVFFPAAIRDWCVFVPIVGQQLQLERIFSGGGDQLLRVGVLGCFTVILAILVLRVTANRLKRDEIIYGN